MKPISGEDILKAWSNTKLKTGVYIHSPFCKEQCEYCTFKGTFFEKESFHRYYSEYLPNQIKFYEPILSSDLIRNYFFGGGTPSLMSPEIMRNLFDLIPNFKDCPRKLMEFHMADYTHHVGQLDVLKEYNFNTVIACVQSFDREVVKQQKRRAPREEKIFEFLNYANSLGLFTMSDVIFFDTGDFQKDLDRLSSDIQKLIDHDISEISVQTIFDELGKYDVIVSGLVNKFLNDNTQYCVGGMEGVQQEDYFRDDSGRKCRKELKMYKREIDWDEMSQQDIHLDGLMTNPEMLLATNYNVLGIGSYKNHKHTFSRIEDKLEYVEAGDTFVPKWMCTYDKKDWPMKKLVADFYEYLEETIGDPPDGIDFTFTSIVEQTDEDDSTKKEVKRRLIPNYRWPLNPEEPFITIEKYVSKLKEIL